MAGSEGSGHIHSIAQSNIDTLKACTFCGRRFIPASLEKHEKICQRTFIDKRKVFNSQSQRIKDPPKNSGSGSGSGSGSPSKSQESNNRTKITYLKSRWREKHEDLISTVRAARGVSVAQKDGKPLPAMPRSLIPSDYTMCDYCNRHFSIKAADRHIEWCKEQKSRLGQGPKVALLARERLEARIKYKAPALRRKSGPKGTSKAATKVQSEKDCKDPRGKPPTRGSVSRALDLNEHAANMSMRGNAYAQRAGSRDNAQMDYAKSYGEGPQRRTPPGGLIGQRRNESASAVTIQGRSAQPPQPAKYKNGGGKDGYNPYVAAEQQMRDLLEGSSEASRGQLRPKQSRDGRAHGGSMSSQVANANRDTRVQPPQPPPPQPPPPGRRATIQVRDKEHKLALADLSAYAYSDSEDDESLTAYSERGSGDLRATYTLVSSDKVNRNESANARLFRKSHRNGVASQASDSSSIITRRQSTQSPPLKLPSPMTPATNSSSSSSGGGNNNNNSNSNSNSTNIISHHIRGGSRSNNSSSSNLWQRGRSTAHACDHEQRLSTSSSDSSLPPLNNNNQKNAALVRRHVHPNANANGIGRAKTACFCHECGTCYPVTSAKFCCECGTRRLILV